MNESIVVRRATDHDAPELARLRYAQRATLTDGAEDSTAFLQRCERWMSAHLRSDAWRCWVAERDDALLGMIWLHIIEKIPNPVFEPELHGYITSFFVRETARNCGVGSALLGAVLRESAADRLDALILWPTERSRPLYARHGFVVRDDILERRPAHGRIPGR